MTDNLEDFAPELITLAQDMAEDGEIPVSAMEHHDLATLALSVLRLPWTWGGAECVGALARRFSRRIVHQEDGQELTFMPPSGVMNLPPWRIVHRYGAGPRQSRRTHYESVLLFRPHQIRSIQVRVCSWA